MRSYSKAKCGSIPDEQPAIKLIVPVGAMQVTNASQDIFVVSHENLSGLNAVAKDNERQKGLTSFHMEKKFIDATDFR